MAAQQPAVHHARAHARRLDVEHDEIDQPIVHEHAVAHVHVVRERFVRDGNLARLLVPLGREHDVVARR